MFHSRDVQYYMRSSNSKIVLSLVIKNSKSRQTYNKGLNMCRVVPTGDER